MSTCLLPGCRDDLSDSLAAPVRSNDFGDREHEMVGTISFSLEAITYGEVVSSGKGKEVNILDVIDNQQSIDRQDIKIGIYPDGTVDLISERAKPVRLAESDAFKAVPPSDISPVHRTVIENGMVSLFAKSGSLIHQTPIEPDADALTSFQKLLGKYDWKKYVASSGAVTEDLNNNTYLIRTLVPSDQLPSSEGTIQKSYEGMYQEEVVVDDLNILLGSSLHLADGTVIMRNVYKYKTPDENGVWAPEISYHEEYLDNAVTGSATVRKTTNYYDNFVITETK